MKMRDVNGERRSRWRTVENNDRDSVVRPFLFFFSLSLEKCDKSAEAVTGRIGKAVSQNYTR